MASTVTASHTSELTRPLLAEGSNIPFVLGTLEGAAAALPLVVQPRDDTDPASLVRYIHSSPDTVAGWLRSHGAVLFRGFNVKTAQDFEDIAKAIDPNLGREYLGTSPRVNLTEYTFTASELPGFYPIPQHIEMSFLPSAPRRVFFSALAPNSSEGGETPLADFRAVWRDLDPKVKERFERLGVRNVRNLPGPATRISKLDWWAFKRWDEMFQTKDRDEIERRARAQGMTPVWKEGDRLALVNSQPAVRKHPESGEPVWFNHVQVLHPSSFSGELRRIARLQRPLQSMALAAAAALLTWLQRKRMPEEDFWMNVTYGDGSPITFEDAEAVREAIWRNLVVYRWQQGDVVVIDNHAVSHGRLPYRGDRLIAVAWA